MLFSFSFLFFVFLGGREWDMEKKSWDQFLESLFCNNLLLNPVNLIYTYYRNSLFLFCLDKIGQVIV